MNGPFNGTPWEDKKIKALSGFYFNLFLSANQGQYNRY